MAGDKGASREEHTPLESDGKTIRRPVTFALPPGESPASTVGLLVQVTGK